MKAPQSHLKGRCVSTEKADCESSGAMGIRHRLSPSEHFHWLALQRARGALLSAQGRHLTAVIGSSLLT